MKRILISILIVLFLLVLVSIIPKETLAQTCEPPPDFSCTTSVNSSGGCCRTGVTESQDQWCRDLTKNNATLCQKCVGCPTQTIPTTPECTSEFPQFCPNINQCIKSHLDCNNFVKDCGGFKFYFCLEGNKAVCVSNTPACTPTGFDPSTVTNCGGEILFCPKDFKVQCSSPPTCVPTVPTSPTKIPPTAGPLPDPNPNEIIDQKQTNNVDLDYLVAGIEAQTFTAGVTGNLSRVALSLGKIGNPTHNLFISITNVSNGLPGTTLLSDEVSVSGSEVTGGVMVFTFNQQPKLTAGRTYAIRVRSDEPIGNPGGFLIGATRDNPYAGGAPACTGCSYDWFFATYMTNATMTVPSGEAAKTYTIAEGYSSEQGPMWHYYYKDGANNPTKAIYGEALMCAGTCTSGPFQGQTFFGQPDNLYWNAGPDTWMWVDPDMNTGGDKEIAIIYWQAPKQGLISMSVTDQRLEFSGAGTGYSFGAGYVSSVGDWPASFLKTINLPSTNLDLQSFTINQSMVGDGDAIMYFKNSNGSTFGDGSRYTISITLTPTKEVPIASSPPPPSQPPPPLQGAASCGTSDPARATELVSTPELFGKFATKGGCVIDPKVIFFPFKIKTYADLKSFYFDRAKFQTKTITSLPSSFATDGIYLVNGDLTVSASPTGSGTQLIFVDGNLTISANYTYGATASSGTVFMVSRNVVIDEAVTQVDAVIIAQGTIYTAGNDCSTSQVSEEAPKKPIKPLVINGSLIALNEASPIKFCRDLLSDNKIKPAEIINQQPKYLILLRDIFSETLQKWEEVP